MLSFLPVDATFSAGQYAELAHAEIDALLAAATRPIVVGGTGLYLRAALTELSLRPAAGRRGSGAVAGRARGRDGPQALHATLVRRAPWAAAEIDPGDRQRIVRALELFDAGELEPPEGESELWTDTVRRPTLLVGLVMDREQLYARIDARVDRMVDAGAAEEVSRANVAGASITARKALGFDELLTGDVEAMKRRTRNYARRQLTWMRKLVVGHRDRRHRARPRRCRCGDRAAVAQGSGVNGYIRTAATTTVKAHTAIALRDTPLRAIRSATSSRCPGITITM